MKKSFIKLMTVVIFVVMLSFLFVGRDVFADDGLYAIVLSPMNQRMILAPGEEYHGSLMVSNPGNSKQDLNYRVSIGSFSQVASEESKDDYGDVDTTMVSNYNQIMDWITLDRDSGTVAPNNIDYISFTIRVPEDAPAGGQYATINVRNAVVDSEDIREGFYIQDTAQVASIIYAEVAGETRKEGAIMDNSIPGFIMSSDLEAVSMVRNDGNVHTDAEYVLQVWPLFSDEEICTNEEDPATSLIMPETSRYHEETCELPMMGIFRAKQKVKIFGETSIVEKTVIICPLWLLFIIFFVIFALMFYFIVKAKNRKKTVKGSESA